MTEPSDSNFDLDLSDDEDEIALDIEGTSGMDARTIFKVDEIFDNN